MLKLHALIAYSLLFTPISQADVIISAKPTTWSANFASNDEAIQEVSRLINGNFIFRDSSVDFDPSSLSPSQIQELGACVNGKQFKTAPGCVRKLERISELLAKQVKQACIGIMDEIEVFSVVLDPQGQTEELLSSPVIQAMFGAAPPTDPATIQNWLSPFVQNFIWRLPLGHTNCLGVAIAAITPQATSAGFLEYVDPNMTAIAQDLSGDDWKFGDIVHLNFFGDFHAVLYLGKDATTGKRMVLTKNGKSALPILVQDLNSIIAGYEEYFGQQAQITRFRKHGPTVKGIPYSPVNTDATDPIGNAFKARFLRGR